MKAILLLIPLLVIWNCWADGVREANVGRLSQFGGIVIITESGVTLSSSDIDLTRWSLNHDSLSNLEIYHVNLDLINQSQYQGEKIYIKGKINIGCPRTGIGGCSIFSMGFGYVVIPFLDGVQISEPEFTSQKLEQNNMEFSFHMLFNDPTLQTAETHEYKIEFWDCEWGQVKRIRQKNRKTRRGNNHGELYAVKFFVRWGASASLTS